MPDADASCRSAREYCALRRCGEAVALWEHASFLRPLNPDIHYQLGFCYAAGCGEHSVLDSAIAIYHYRRALSQAGRGNTVARAMILGALGNAYLASPSPGTGALCAIRCYNEAAANYACAGRLDDWAREQFNLGNACCELPEVEFPDKWDQAIEHYQSALSIRTRTRDPIHCAVTLQNLGTAYRELKSGVRSANIRRAVGCYHRALRVLRGEPTEKRMSDLYHNLGNAYLTLSDVEVNFGRHIQRAVHHFTCALIGRSKDRAPFDYATTQFSRGQALFALGARGGEGDSGLGKARECLAEAADLFSATGHGHLAAYILRYLDMIDSKMKANGNRIPSLKTVGADH